MIEAAVRVGYSTRRPVVPDEKHTTVIVVAENETDAQLIAAQVVATHCEMVTSTEIVEFLRL